MKKKKSQQRNKKSLKRKRRYKREPNGNSGTEKDNNQTFKKQPTNQINKPTKQQQNRVYRWRNI